MAFEQKDLGNAVVQSLTISICLSLFLSFVAYSVNNINSPMEMLGPNNEEIYGLTLGSFDDSHLDTFRDIQSRQLACEPGNTSCVGLGATGSTQTVQLDPLQNFLNFGKIMASIIGTIINYTLLAPITIALSLNSLIDNPFMEWMIFLFGAIWTIYQSMMIYRFLLNK